MPKILSDHQYLCFFLHPWENTESHFPISPIFSVTEFCAMEFGGKVMTPARVMANKKILCNSSKFSSSKVIQVRGRASSDDLKVPGDAGATRWKKTMKKYTELNNSPHYIQTHPTHTECN